MTFYTEKLTKFHGKINSIDFYDEEQFLATQSILRDIENVFKNDNYFANDIYFSDGFIEDLLLELESIRSKYDDDSYYQIAEELKASIYFEKEDLSDLKFNYLSLPLWFKDINENLKNRKYDFKTPTLNPTV